MRKTILTAIIWVAILQITLAQSPDFTWANNAGWIGGIGGSGSLAYDEIGHIYMANDFASSSIAFGSVVLTNYSNNANSTICIVKYDTLGNVVWARTAGGDFNYIKPVGIAADLFGNIYVTGYFDGDSIIFDNITLRNPYMSGFQENMFIVKYSDSGTVLWGKCAADGSNTYQRCRGNGVAVDANGNPYLIGNFSSRRIILNHDTIFNANAVNYPSNDIFLVKLNPSGNTIWARDFGGMKDDAGNSISVKNNNIYITGNFNSKTISLGGTILTNQDTNGYYSNLFLAKSDTAGNVIWAKSNKTQGNSIGIGVVSNANDQINLCGNFTSQNIIFGNDTLTNSSGGNNLFSATFDTNGNPIWAKNPELCYDASVYSIAAGTNGNFYITGRFDDQYIKFDSTTLTNAYGGYYDIFIVEYDSTGNVVWAKSIGGTNNDFGKGITTASGSIYIAGITWSSSMTFGSIVLNAHSAPYGNDDIYFAKLSGACAGVNVTQQPGNLFKLTGQIASFSVVATGSPIIFYQWYRNNYPITGANSSSYSTPSLEAYNDGDTYYCLISNCSFSNSVKSTIDTLEVCTGASIYSQPVNVSAAIGDTAVFKVFASGTQPLTYQWYKNGLLIPGATDSVYTTPILIANDSGNIYYCKILNCIGLSNIQTNNAILTIISTGIFDVNNAENKIQIYPNPATDRVYIDCDKRIDLKMQVYDIIGECVLQSVLTSGVNEIDISYLTAGIYTIRLTGADRTIQIKLIMN